MSTYEDGVREGLRLAEEYADVLENSRVGTVVSFARANRIADAMLKARTERAEVALPDGWEWRTELDGNGWYASDGETWVSCQRAYVNFTKDSDVMGIPIAVVEAVIARNKQGAK